MIDYMNYSFLCKDYNYVSSIVIVYLIQDQINSKFSKNCVNNNILYYLLNYVIFQYGFYLSLLKYFF
jgi:hypothetical protein